MTNLEIALKLREQIKAKWPYVSTILALYENNTKLDINELEDFHLGSEGIKGVFTERIQDMVDRLLPKEVFYQEASPNNIDIAVSLIKETIYKMLPIKSLPINQVLFSSDNNPEGKL